MVSVHAGGVTVADIEGCLELNQQSILKFQETSVKLLKRLKLFKGNAPALSYRKKVSQKPPLHPW